MTSPQSILIFISTKYTLRSRVVLQCQDEDSWYWGARWDWIHISWPAMASWDAFAPKVPNFLRDESLLTFILLLKHCDTRTDCKGKVQYNCLSYSTALRLQLVLHFYVDLKSASSPLLINVKQLGNLYFLVLFFLKQLACKTILMNPAIPGRDECQVSLWRTPLFRDISTTVALGFLCRIDGLGSANEFVLYLIAFIMRYSTQYIGASTKLLTYICIQGTGHCYLVVTADE